MEEAAAGLTPRGQRSWETEGREEDERSKPRLDTPKAEEDPPSPR